jgi:hypothetical protein
VSTRADKAYFHWLRSESVQNPLLQQVQLGSSVSQALDQFDPANLTFTLAGAPGCNQDQLNRFIVVREALSHCSERLQARLGSCLKPGVKRLDIMLCQNSSEALLKAVPLSQCWIDLQNSFQFLFIGVTELTVGLYHPPMKPSSSSIGTECGRPFGAPGAEGGTELTL